MKALQVTALSPDLSGTGLVDLPEPEPHPDRVLIRVKAAALNFPDLLMTKGEYQLKPPLPFVPGMEVAGEVIAVRASRRASASSPEHGWAGSPRSYRSRSRRCGGCPGICPSPRPRASARRTSPLTSDWSGWRRSSRASGCWSTARPAASAWRRSISPRRSAAA